WVGDCMIKSELILRVGAQKPRLYNRDVEKVVNTIFDEIEAALVRRDRVELRGFGTFILKTRRARLGRNPKTGAEVNVPETRHPTFRTGKEMRGRLNDTILCKAQLSERRIREHPLVAKDIPVYGYIYDVYSGNLVEVTEETEAGRAR